jgi:AbrB family looped-hinge helix DNA binding protein
MNQAKTMTARLGSNGRLVIPAHVREMLGLKEGDVLSLSLEEGRLVLTSPQAVLKELQAHWARIPRDRVLSQELVDERRQEAEREANA